MCGIIGIINRDNAPVDERELKLMLQEIKHRGPDAQGNYINSNLALGHTRLSIIDVSDLANQPFHYLEDYVITFNGAIYNYIEIAEELKLLGYVIKTKCDTEVLLLSYVAWGEECVHKFNGMWAFAIFDKKKNKLFCSRDRFGIKPFFYLLNDEKFIFASEIKPILSVTKCNKVNTAVALQYLTFSSSEYHDQTFFDTILKLLPSHNLSFDLQNNKIKIYKYYEVSHLEEIFNLSLEEAINKIDIEFKRAIDLNLRADVKIASSLSGGLDSSYILNEVVKNKQKNKQQIDNFTAITVGSINKNNDETSYANLVSRILEVESIVIKPSAQDFQSLMNEVIYIQEEPFGGKSIHMQNFLMNETNRLGVKVLLSGQGADELLLGYSFYIAAYFSKIPIWQYLKLIYNLRTKNKISYFILLKSNIFYNKLFSRKLFYNFKNYNLNRKYKRQIDYKPLQRKVKSFNNLFELQKNEIFIDSLPEMLKWEDKNSMRYAVESRLPFLDHKFVEVCLSINPNHKICHGWTKYLIRKNIEGQLPDEIVWRKEKLGFEPPFNEWWPPEKFIIDKINDSKIINEFYNKKFKSFTDRELEWRLYNLAIWEEQYKMAI